MTVLLRGKCGRPLRISHTIFKSGNYKLELHLKVGLMHLIKGTVLILSQNWLCVSMTKWSSNGAHRGHCSPPLSTGLPSSGSYYFIIKVFLALKQILPFGLQNPGTDGNKKSSPLKCHVFFLAKVPKSIHRIKFLRVSALHIL